MDDKTAAGVLSRIDDRGMLALLCRLIKIPSFKNEETPVARFLARFFKRRGYEVDLQEVEPGRFQTIATLKGAGGGKSLMFNGHIVEQGSRDEIINDPQHAYTKALLGAVPQPFPQ